MNLEILSSAQKQAMMDLLVLGIYSDGHLALAEDAAVQKLARVMGFLSDHPRRRFVDDSFARISRIRHDAGAIREQVAAIAATFPAPELRHVAGNTLRELLTSDRKITAEETRFLDEVAKQFDCDFSAPPPTNH